MLQEEVEMAKEEKKEQENIEYNNNTILKNETSMNNKSIN